MKNNRNFHLKNFVIYQDGWALLCTTFAFLFVLLQEPFRDPSMLETFIVTWWIYIAVAAAVALLMNGGFRKFGINIEFEHAYWLNTKVVNKRVEGNISNKDLKKLFYILKKEPINIFKKESAFTIGAVLASLATMFYMGAAWQSLVFIAISGIIAVFLLGFYSLFAEEYTYASVLRDCRAKLRDRNIEVEELDTFSLKQRFNYFLFLFFLLLVIILSFAPQLDLLLIMIIFLSFVAAITANELLASSVYSVFQEISDFAERFPRQKGSRFFSGSYFKEASDIVRNFNKSAQKLEQVYDSIGKEKNKINTIINNFSYPVIFIGENNTIDMFNTATEEVLGFKKKDYGSKVSSKNNFDIRNFQKMIRLKDYYIKDPEEVEGYVKGGNELVIKKKEGERVFKVSTRKVTGENGEYLGMLKVFSDVSREETINKLKSEFISVAAHQLRTPLSAIKWVIKMVMDEDAGKLKDQQKEFMDKGYKSTQRVIALVDNLLYVSRIEEGRFGYSFRTFNSAKLIEDTASELWDAAQERELNFEVKKPKEMPNIYGDPEKIKLGLYYLLDNAIKYTPWKGTVELEAKVINDKNDLFIKVKDNGVGIPKEGQDKLFSKFYRGPNVLRMQTEGNGLGMFIVKSIVDKHGGTIDLESEEGRGTEVKITIPIRKEKEVLGGN